MVEKEALALIWVLQHFEVYVGSDVVCWGSGVAFPRTVFCLRLCMLGCCGVPGSLVVPGFIGV